MNHALQTQAAVSPASQAGTGLSVTSPAHLVPLATAAGSSAPAAGLERPVSQIRGTARAVTPAGWGPGEGAGLLRMGCTFLQEPHPRCSLWGRQPTPNTHSHCPLRPATWQRLKGEKWVLMRPWAVFSSSSPTTQVPAFFFLQRSLVCHLFDLAPASRPYLHLSFTAEDPQLGLLSPEAWGKMGNAPLWGPVLLCPPFQVLPHLSCEDPCPSGTFGKGCGSTCPTCVQGACDAMTGECVCNAGYWGPR